MKDNNIREKIILYPNNILTTKLMEMKSFLPFDVIAIVDEMSSVVSDTSYQLDDAFKKADALIIMDDNPCTMLMPPFNKEAKKYVGILILAQNFNVCIFSPFFEVPTCDCYNNNNTNKTDLRIRETDANNSHFKSSIFQGSKNMMITSTTRKSNNYIAEILLQKYLLSYSICSLILSEMPIFENNIQFEKMDMVSAKLTILDGPMQGNPMLFGGVSSNQEIRKWDFIMGNKPDGTLLIIEESDTYEMVKETVEYLNDIKCRVFALIYKSDFNVWYKEFLQAKLGIPVLYFGGNEIPFRLINLIINAFFSKGW